MFKKFIYSLMIVASVLMCNSSVFADDTGASPRWKAPVQTASDLEPLTSDGSVRVSLDDGKMHVFDAALGAWNVVIPTVSGYTKRIQDVAGTTYVDTEMTPAEGIIHLSAGGVESLLINSTGITVKTGVLNVGDGTTSTNDYLYANNGVTNLPALRYNNLTSTWQFSNDGLAFTDMGSGGGGEPLFTAWYNSGDASLNSLTLTVPYNPFDQTLNTADDVAFQKVSLARLFFTTKAPVLFGANEYAIDEGNVVTQAQADSDNLLLNYFTGTFDDSTFTGVTHWNSCFNTGDVGFMTGSRIKMGAIDLSLPPTATLELSGSNVGAPGTGPLKIQTASVLLVTPEPGIMEADGTGLYWTNASGERESLAFNQSLNTGDDVIFRTIAFNSLSAPLTMGQYSIDEQNVQLQAQNDDDQLVSNHFNGAFDNNTHSGVLQWNSWFDAGDVAIQNKVKIGSTFGGLLLAAPVAQLEITGEAVFGTVPLVINNTGLVMSPVAGAIENDGTALYYTNDSLVRSSLTNLWAESAGTLAPITTADRVLLGGASDDSSSVLQVAGDLNMNSSNINNLDKIYDHSGDGGFVSYDVENRQIDKSDINGNLEVIGDFTNSQLNTDNGLSAGTTVVSVDWLARKLYRLEPSDNSQHEVADWSGAGFQVTDPSLGVGLKRYTYFNPVTNNILLGYDPELNGYPATIDSSTNNVIMIGNGVVGSLDTFNVGFEGHNIISSQYSAMAGEAASLDVYTSMLNINSVLGLARVAVDFSGNMYFQDGISGTNTLASLLVARNPFDQSLNTTDNVKFHNLEVVKYTGTEDYSAYSPVSYWKYNENSGMIAVDSANGHNGTLGGVIGPSWVPGISGSGLSFPGDQGDSYVQISYDASWMAPAHWSIIGWYKASNVYVHSKWLLSRPEPGHVPYLLTVLSAGGKLVAETEFSYSNGQFTGSMCDGTSSLGDNKWHFLAGTYDGTYLKIYVDGNLENTVDTTGLTPDTSLADMFLGETYGGGNSDAVQDEIAFFNYALTDVDILAMYNQERVQMFNVTDSGVHVGTYSMPVDSGTNSYVLTTNGIDTASWQPVAPALWTEVGSVLSPVTTTDRVILGVITSPVDDLTSPLQVNNGTSNFYGNNLVGVGQVYDLTTLSYDAGARTIWSVDTNSNSEASADFTTGIQTLYADDGTNMGITIPVLSWATGVVKIKDMYSLPSAYFGLPGNVITDNGDGTSSWATPPIPLLLDQTVSQDVTGGIPRFDAGIGVGTAAGSAIGTIITDGSNMIFQDALTGPYTLAQLAEGRIGGILGDIQYFGTDFTYGGNTLQGEPRVHWDSLGKSFEVTGNFTSNYIGNGNGAGYNPSANPLFYWNIYEGTGTTLHDQTSLHLDGTMSGTASWITGVTTYGVQLDGNTGIVTLPYSSDLDVSGFNIAAWVKYTYNGSGDMSILKKMDSGTGQINYRLGIEPQGLNNGVIVADFTTGGGTPVTQLRSTVKTNDGAWHQICFSYDNSSGNGILWIDGRLVDIRHIAATPDMPAVDVIAGGPYGAASTTSATIQVDDIAFERGSLEGSPTFPKIYFDNGKWLGWSTDENGAHLKDLVVTRETPVYAYEDNVSGVQTITFQDTNSQTPGAYTATIGITPGDENFLSFNDSNLVHFNFADIGALLAGAPYIPVGGETDPVVGAVTGIVKADGIGGISAAVDGSDYLSQHTGLALSEEQSYGSNITFSPQELNNYIPVAQWWYTPLMITMNSDVTDKTSNAHSVSHSRSLNWNLSSPFVGYETLNFTGSSPVQYLTVTDAPDLTPSADFEYDLYVRFNSIGYKGFLNKYQDSDNYFAFWYDGANIHYYAIEGSSVVADYTYTWTPSTSTWYRLDLVRLGGASFTLYINGVAVTWTTVTQAWGVLGQTPNTGNLIIGTDNTLANDFDGQIAQFRYYSAAIVHTGLSFSLPTHPDYPDLQWMDLSSLPLPTTPTFDVVTANTYNLADGSDKNHTLSVYASGTNAEITNTDGLAAFGTTSPTLTINKAGTYLIRARVNQYRDNASHIITHTITYHLRRTNNTATNLTDSFTSYVDQAHAASTETEGIFDLPTVIYTTANTDDVIELWVVIDSATTSGKHEVAEANIVAERLY